MYEQRQIARNLSPCYSDNICPIYHSRIQIYETLDERCKKDAADVLTAIAAHTCFEEQNKNLESDDDGYEDFNDQFGYSAKIITSP